MIPFQELYIFNKFGQHVLTKDIMTSSVVYRMSYTQATSNGRLDSVTDAAGRKLTIVRDLRGQVSVRVYLFNFKFISNIENITVLQLTLQLTNLTG